MTIFYITDFQIDLSRSVVIKGGIETQVEPKVLKVLLLLAQSQNEVLTHQEIMDQVWQGTEVVPNALQRCIAILRKVLNDDAKAPTVIATHPRIGYRLLAEVRWKPLLDKQKNIKPAAKKNTKQQTTIMKFILPLVALVMLILAVATQIFWSDNLPNQYTQIHSLTQTDAYESHALFSPNTEYLVFNRDAGLCKSHLWVKHIASGQENRLTSQAGSYGAMSFTSDGRELVFAAKKHCDQSNNRRANQTDEQLCWNIATLDFALALSSPQMPSFRHQCQAERLEAPKALSNHQYAFLQYTEGGYQLMHYDDLSKKLTSLYSSEDLYIYDFDYDAKHNRFALISRDKGFNNVLQILDDKGGLQSHEIIELDQGMSQNQHFSINFEPQGKYLLATSNSRLYRIHLNGQLQIIKTPESNLISVVKHPTRQELLAIKGKKDIDIGQITLEEEPLTSTEIELTQQKLPFANLARSAAQDKHALYQPNGEQIAFISDRSGQDELWLWHKGKATQLSFLSPQASIQNFSWSPDGKQLAWASNDGLAIIDLKGEVQLLSTDKPLYSVLSWYGENQLLVLLNDPQPGGLYRFDFQKNTLRPFGVNQVEGAWVYHNQLIYSNVHGEVFTRSLDENNTEIKRLAQLNGKTLLINESFIYSVNPDSFILNQYNLTGQFIKPVTHLNASAWRITGLKNDQLLLSQFIALNHDIVMLQ